MVFHFCEKWTDGPEQKKLTRPWLEFHGFIPAEFSSTSSIGDACEETLQPWNMIFKHIKERSLKCHRFKIMYLVQCKVQIKTVSHNNGISVHSPLIILAPLLYNQSEYCKLIHCNIVNATVVNIYIAPFPESSSEE